MQSRLRLKKFRLEPQRFDNPEAAAFDDTLQPKASKRPRSTRDDNYDTAAAVDQKILEVLEASSQSPNKHYGEQFS
jgi:hypothetical protein